MVFLCTIPGNSKSFCATSARKLQEILEIPRVDVTIILKIFYHYYNCCTLHFCPYCCFCLLCSGTYAPLPLPKLPFTFLGDFPSHNVPKFINWSTDFWFKMPCNIHYSLRVLHIILSISTKAICWLEGHKKHFAIRLTFGIKQNPENLPIWREHWEATGYAV